MEDNLADKPNSTSNSQNKALQLMQKAEEADSDFDFSLAYRLFIQAAHEFDKLQDTNQANVCLVRAATCLEKFQVWRGHSALWEYFGNRLGNLVNSDYKFNNPNNPGQSGMYHIISWQEWKRPENGYYGDDFKSEQRHQQAWAYMWGAEEAEAENRHGLAGKLFRKSAISWELCRWGDRSSDQTDEYWTKERIEKKHGNKWRLAARFYFQAVYNLIQDKGKNPNEAKLFLPYLPHEVGWGRESSRTNEAVYDMADDIDRMIRCWRKYGEAKNNVVDAFEECNRQISILLDQLTHIGKRKDLTNLYQKKKKLELEIYALQGKWAHPFHWLYYHMTGSGSNLSKTSLTVFLPLYVLIFPVIYFMGGLFEHGSNTSLPIGFSDAILFSLSNAITISISDYAAKGFIGYIVQTANAFSAVFVIGYVLWLMNRSFEE